MMSRDKITVEDFLSEIRAAQDEPSQQAGMIPGANPDMSKIMAAVQKHKTELAGQQTNQVG